MAKKRISRDELAREIGCEDEDKIISAINKSGNEEVIVKNHEGRKLRVKVKRIDPVEAVDDRDDYS